MISGLFLVVGLATCQPHYGGYYGYYGRRPTHRSYAFSLRPSTGLVDMLGYGIPSDRYQGIRTPSLPYIPAAPRTYSRPRSRPRPVIYKSVQQRPGINSFPEANLFDVNIVKNTREAVDNAKKILEGLKNDRISAPYVTEVLASSRCLNSIDDAIAAVEASARLVEENGPELSNLAVRFQQLEGEDDPVKQTRTTAALLRTLQDLLPRLTASPISTRCSDTAEQRVSGLADLASLLDRVATTTRAARPRQAIQFSARQTRKLASFLGKLSSQVASLQDSNLCARADYQTSIYSTIEGIMTDLADYMGDVSSNATRAVAIRRKAAQFSRLAEAFQTAGLSLEQPCGSYSSYAELADTLDDLAVIIEDVGLETLYSELGIELDF